MPSPRTLSSRLFGSLLIDDLPNGHQEAKTPQIPDCAVSLVGALHFQALRKE